MEKPLPLDQFGRALMERVYDPSIWSADALVRGHLKGERAATVQSTLASMTPELQETLHLLLPKIVEQVIFKALFFLDEEKTELKIDGEVAIYERGELAGWLFDEEGWIAQFSQFKQQKQG